jgi:hypothetical protein
MGMPRRGMHSRVCTTVGISGVSSTRNSEAGASRSRPNDSRECHPLLYPHECVDPQSWTTALLVPLAIASVIETSDVSYT